MTFGAEYLLQYRVRECHHTQYHCYSCLKSSLPRPVDHGLVCEGRLEGPKPEPHTIQSLGTLLSPSSHLGRPVR